MFVATALNALKKGVVCKEIKALPPAHVIVDLKRVIPDRSAVQTMAQQVTAELWKRSCELEARQSRRSIKRCPEERRLLIERIGQLCVAVRGTPSFQEVALTPEVQAGNVIGALRLNIVAAAAHIGHFD